MHPHHVRPFHHLGLLSHHVMLCASPGFTDRLVMVHFNLGHHCVVHFLGLDYIYRVEQILQTRQDTDA
jgi:hypothetical protein